MNPEVTSKEEILQVCRKIVAQKGLPSFSIRAVAKECGIAPGTLYNYYSDKDALLIATVESVWKEILQRSQREAGNLPFPDFVTDLFCHIRDNSIKYPGFLTAHSLSIANVKKEEAKGAMEQCFSHIKAELLAALRADSVVDNSVFSEKLTESDFLDFVLENLLLQLFNDNPKPAILEEVIRQLIYRKK